MAGAAGKPSPPPNLKETHGSFVAQGRLPSFPLIEAAAPGAQRTQQISTARQGTEASSNPSRDTPTHTPKHGWADLFQLRNKPLKVCLAPHCPCLKAKAWTLARWPEPAMSRWAFCPGLRQLREPPAALSHELAAPSRKSPKGPQE